MTALTPHQVGKILVQGYIRDVLHRLREEGLLRTMAYSGIYGLMGYLSGKLMGTFLTCLAEGPVSTAAAASLCTVLCICGLFQGAREA